MVKAYDVASLDLTGLQEELLKAVYSTGTPTIAVLINGRAIINTLGIRKYTCNR